MSDDLDRPMTRKDFALIVPLLLTEVVTACTSPLVSHLSSEERLVNLANQLYQLGTALSPDADGRELVVEIAAQLMASEPGA